MMLLLLLLVTTFSYLDNFSKLFQVTLSYPEVKFWELLAGRFPCRRRVSSIKALKGGKLK